MGFDLHIHLAVHDDEAGLKGLAVDVPHGHLLRRAVCNKLPCQFIVKVDAMMSVMDDEPALLTASRLPGITAVAVFRPDDVSFSANRASAHNS